MMLVGPASALLVEFLLQVLECE